LSHVRAAGWLASTLVLGCGSEVAQTAFLPPDEPETPDALECGEPGALTPPAAPELGGARSVELSDLVSSTYGASEGPGIYVTARDGFRLFLNGAFLAESRAARAPEFVPLTLLPGKNVIGVVAYAESGVPAALLQIDELLRTYATDGTWKVSAEPEVGWTDPGFDASGFVTATDYGPVGSRPGCDPQSVFPTNSPAHWIGPSRPERAVALRYEIDIQPVGFASAVTGGGSGVPVLVTTIPEFADWLSDDTPQVLVFPEGEFDFSPAEDEIQMQTTCRTPCADGGEVYTVLVGDATCPTELVDRPRNDRRLSVGSNKTVVGLGRGAQLRGASFDFSASRNVIFRNLAIYDVNRDLIEAGDAMDFSAVDGVWADHLTFKWISDGFTDSRPGSKGLTISWSRYDGVNDLACGDRHPRAAQLADTEATFHHNMFVDVNGRSPEFDHALSRGHLFNNVMSNNAEFAVGAVCGAEVLLEGNSFDNVAIPTLRTDCSENPDLLGYIRVVPDSNLYDEDVGAHRSGGTDSSTEPNDPEVFTPPYEYQTDAARDAAPLVTSRAGAGGPWKLPLALAR
jgi:pectate lyase